MSNCGRHNAELLSNAYVGIAGLGGLGSNVAASLARCGLGKLLLVDFDDVELSNINRQQYRLKDVGKPKTEALEGILHEISPIITIEKRRIKIDRSNSVDIFADCDIVCECFDSPTSKQQLVEAMLLETNKPIVAASGLAGYGRSNEIITKKINARLFMVGDMESGIDKFGGLYAPRVAIAANHQANKVLELILGSK